MRRVARTLSFAVAVCCLAVPLSSRAADQLKIRTDKGKVQGKLSDDGQVRIFLGIPYAAAASRTFSLEASATRSEVEGRA